jgi:hypothetical protein
MTSDDHGSPATTRPGGIGEAKIPNEKATTTEGDHRNVGLAPNIIAKEWWRTASRASESAVTGI